MSEDSRQDCKYRVLIVDRHVLVGQGISALFRASGEVTSMATVAGQAASFAEHFMPHVAMVDVSATVRLPGAGTSTDADAFSMATEIVQRSPKTRLLFVDEAVHPLRVHRSLHAGGAGYWTKHSPFDQLFQAVRRIARGQWCFCPDVREHLRFDNGHWHLKPSCRFAAANLTRRESQVMDLLVEGLSVRQCAARMNLSPNTVDNHKSSIMRKLGVHKMSELVRLAFSQGMADDE